MKKKKIIGLVALGVVAALACYSVLLTTHLSESRVRSSCLEIFKKEIPGTSEVAITETQRLMKSDMEIQISGRGAERRGNDTIYNGLAKPFTMTFRRYWYGWRLESYSFGVEGNDTKKL